MPPSTCLRIAWIQKLTAKHAHGNTPGGHISRADGAYSTVGVRGRRVTFSASRRTDDTRDSIRASGFRTSTCTRGRCGLDPRSLRLNCLGIVLLEETYPPIPTTPMCLLPSLKRPKFLLPCVHPHKHLEISASVACPCIPCLSSPDADPRFSPTGSCRVTS